MEKISKVVPGSVKNNIDMTKERPMRSGAPSYGAPVAFSTATLKKMEEQSRAAALAEQQKQKLSPEEAKHSEIVDKVTLSFNKAPEPILLQEEIQPSVLEESEPIEMMEDVVMDDIRENMGAPDEIEHLSVYA